MDLQEKISQNSGFKRIKKKREFVFFTLMLVITISLIMMNFLLPEKKYLKIKLYIYNSKNNQFDFESRLIPKSKNKVEKIKDVVNELIYGPVTNGYERLLSPDTIIQFVALSKKNIVYISFNWDIIKSIRKNPAKVITSIVTSIKKNIKEVNGVKILVDGVESINTFNGINLYKTFNVY